MQKKLYTPVNIGKAVLKNRVIMAPMSTGCESEDGKINDVISNYWELRAKGGVGMILVDAVTIDANVPYLTPSTISLGEDDKIESFKTFVDKMHTHGTLVFPQIAHMGAESCTAWAKGFPAVGPSCYHNSAGHMCREMKLEEIPAIIKKYGEAARRARLAGCDGMEFHCAHAYMLPGAFLSSLRNKRTDEYGGNLDNRARLALEAIREIKRVAGSDFPILMRICGSERTPGGNELADMLYLIPKFIEAGVDAFEVSGGTTYEAYQHILPCHYATPGVNIEEAKAIRAISSVPVFVVGKINDARFAEHVVEEDFVDG
ncbi:MAG: NADH:flavin oxidoreductase, partial [Oscillospiraceae bacterium]